MNAERTKSNTEEMLKSSILFLLLFIHLGVCTALPDIVVLKRPNIQLQRVLAASASAPCSETIGECLGEPAEMDSESTRRILLMGKKYISYETLKRDIVPCNRPGASYYKCDAAQANPYTRGCEVIAGCRNSITGIINN